MSRIKSLLKIQKVRVTLALVAISFAVVVSFFLPKESDPNIGLVNDPSIPTVGITSPVGTLMLNHTVNFHNVHFTVLKAEEAAAFSDDRSALVPTLYVYMCIRCQITKCKLLKVSIMLRLYASSYQMGKRFHPNWYPYSQSSYHANPETAFSIFPWWGSYPLPHYRYAWAMIQWLLLARRR